ncbi:MAG TPA: hypothetical protein VH062_25760 [Polyangiaceae bacterium]|jgi:hypothetical protein|nr:hypothetical protein [Polyangiaceae bacterium]
MTAARLPGGNAGLVGSAVIAATVTLFIGGACSPSAGKAGAGSGASGSTASLGGRATGSGGTGAGGGKPMNGGGVASGNVPVGGGPPVGGGGDLQMSGGTTGSGGMTLPPEAGGLPNVGGTCNVIVNDPTPLPACPACTGGRCVNAADYPTAPASELAKCGNTDQICLPDTLVATNGNVALTPCTSVAGAEGRCTSLCIPVAAQLSGVLPQDVCAASDRCAPCFNPVDGSATGICSIGCDPGPQKPAVLFPTCCIDKGTTNARGRCVPRAAIPDGPAKSNLAKETCSGNNDPVCVPTAIIEDPTYKFPTCTDSLFLDPGKPGVCVPSCIVNANPEGAALKQDTCSDTTDKCVPCTNPSNGMPSGACDAP